jgi:threonine/homoserine/homoserine lactone efflux protein
MVDPAVLPGFLLIVLVICVAPGPDMAFITAMSISGGPLAGVRASAGMAAGMAVWTLATALGLAALLHAAPAAMTAIRVAGAAYLLVLGIMTLRSARRATQEPAPPAGRIVLRGLLTNLGNPKIAVFFAAFLPQFVRADAGPAWSQLLTLGLLFLLMGLAVDAAVATAAGALRLTLAPGGRVQVALGVIAGLVLCALAAGLAVEAA